MAQGSSDGAELRRARKAVSRADSEPLMPKYRLGGLYSYLILGVLVWCACIGLELWMAAGKPRMEVSKTTQLTYSFCAVAYGCNGLLGGMKLSFEHNSVRAHLQWVSVYVSALASSTYALLALGITHIQVDMKSVLFIPSRWLLYCCTVPAIWWIIAHISSYTLRRKLYVVWLNVVMLLAGGLATIPHLSWGHKVFWMFISCVPFPELCFHMWRMISDAIEALPPSNSTSALPLHFMRCYGQFSYQFFPAIYFVAFDGCVPVHVTEPLWAICDWCLKMVMTSSLMEANFVSIEQRRAQAIAGREVMCRAANIKELSSAIARKDDFLATISHELCTPLNGIIGLSDALIGSRAHKLPPAILKTATVIKLSGKRLLQLIYDILSTASMTDGMMAIRHEEVDMQALVADVVELAGSLVRKDVEFLTSIQPVPRIAGDTGRVAQVLYNLIGNACKFTAKGYVLVSMTYSPRHDAVSVAVQDTGCGITAESLDVIFEAYEQGDESTARNFGGTGLGLHLVRELVKAHGGRIEVESTPGVGSTFVAWFPRLHVERVPSPTPDHPEADTSVIINARGCPRMRMQSCEIVRPSTASADIDDFGPGSHTKVQVQQPIAEAVADASAELEAMRHDTEGVDWHPVPMTHGEATTHPQVLVCRSATDSRRLFSWLLTGGFTVAVCETGAELLETLATAELLPDVVLLDARLSDMDGCDAVAAIRQKLPVCALPMIIMSNDSSTATVCRGLEAGCTDVIHCPFYQLELLCRIRVQVEARASMRRALRSGASCLRTLKLSAMPSYFRRALAAGQGDALDLGRSTFVVHLAVDWTRLAGGDSALDPSVLLKLHQTFHNIVKRSQCVPLLASPDGWTCVHDPDLPTTLPGPMQVAANLLTAFKALRIDGGIPVWPTLGVAAGSSDSCLGSASEGFPVLTVSTAVTMATRLAATATSDTICVLSATPTPEAPQEVIIGSDVRLVHVNLHDEYTAVDVTVRDLVQAIPHPPALVALMSDLLQLWNLVHSRTDDAISLADPVSGSMSVVNKYSTTDLGSASSESRSLHSTFVTSQESNLATSALDDAFDSSFALGLEAVRAASCVALAAQISPAAIARLPPLQAIATACQLAAPPDVLLRMNATTVAVAFLVADDVPTLGFPSLGAGVRMLTECKRALARAIRQTREARQGSTGHPLF